MRTLKLLLFIVLAALPLHAQQFDATNDPPVVSKIQVSQPNSAGNVVVTGAAGSVQALADVVIATLETGNVQTARALPDGSFTASLFAPAGTSIIIKGGVGNVSPTFNFLPKPATIVRVPDQGIVGEEVRFSGAGSLRHGNPPALPTWTIEGTMSGFQFDPGQTVRLQATVRIRSAALGANPGTVSVNAELGLEKLSDSNGISASAASIGSSSLLTPTGLPIERPAAFGGPTTTFTGPMTRPASDRAEIALDMSLELPATLPLGYYRPFIRLAFTGVPEEPVATNQVTFVDQFRLRPLNLDNGASVYYLPTLRVGLASNPRLFWHLLTDTVSNGTRGVRAVEDRTRTDLAPRTMTQSETFIIPRLNESGTPITYRLEPFLPAISIGDSGTLPNPPRIPFRFPSGNLTVRIRRPDGNTETRGPLPFVQSRSLGLTVANFGIQDSTKIGNISDVYQLSTMDSRFDYQFTQDGLHTITMEGQIQDVWGNAWLGSGTYEVYVARPLVLDTAVLPGTPFEVGNVFNTGLVVSPAVPADVQMQFRMAPNSNAAQMTTQTITGVANRFGYLQPAGHGITLAQAGEYRVDITASWRDDQGNLYMGSRTWGGVVAPTNPSIVARGGRGIDTQSAGSRSPWFFRTQTGIPIGDNHVPFPVQSGDITWQQESDSAIPEIRFQDPGGSIVTLMRTRRTPAQFEELTAIGETPLFSSNNLSLEPHLDPSRIDLWGYNYRVVERPLVRVREEIGEHGIASAHWRFNESHAMQAGGLTEGDLPHDIKFQYGAVVLRGSALAAPQYAIYGSLFVLVPDVDPGGGTRTFPPFQGNGGGPSGGPIFTLKNRSIDMFFHPTAVRPGSVLEVGDTFSVAGAVGPTLAGLVATTVTKPNGTTVSFSGRANSVGYYFNPAHDFIVDTPGIYTVDMTVTFDGRTSAGQVTQPYPRGDILGTSSGRFYVYVVSRGSPSLTVGNTDGQLLAAPGLVTLSATAPTGVTLQSGHMTSTMPGFMLESRALTVSGSALSHQHDPATLSRDFLNLDTAPPVDLVTITLFGTGVDSRGAPTYAAKVVTLNGPRLLNPPVGRTVSFGISDRGGLSLISSGAGPTIDTGFGRIQPLSGSTAPSGIAIFGYRVGGVLVSEAAVPAAAPMLRGRIFAEIGSSANTGIAIANPNSQAANISFYFTDANGNNFGAGSTTIPANNQIARFVNETPFNSGSSLNGTFTFESNVPVGVIALRGLTNEAGNFLMTTLPVSPLSAAVEETIYFPQFADGDGWTTQLILVNPTDETLAGTATFYNDGTSTSAATPFTLTVNGVTASSFNYSIPPRSSRRLITSGSGSIKIGSVRVVPNASNRTPAGVAVFSFRGGGITTSEAGVPATRASTAWRLYTEASGGVEQIRTGLGFVNPSNGPITVNIELNTLTGASTGLTGSITLPANGHRAMFLDEIAGFTNLTTPFRGVMRVSTPSSSGVAIIGLRIRVNEVSNYLLTTTEPINENAAASTSELVFPHLADSGGFTTQFILYSGSASQTSAGTLSIYANTGSVLNLPLQ